MSRVLTMRSVEAAKPGKMLRQISDGGTGLYLQVHRSGIWSWAFRYRYKGRPRKLTIGRYPIIGLADARARARDALALLDHGRDPAAEKQAARRGDDDAERDLFGNAVREYIERHAKVRNRSWPQFAQRLGLRADLTQVPDGIVSRWRGRRIQDIGRRDVRLLLDDMMAEAKASGRRGATVNLTLAMLRSFFSWAVNHDRIPVSPCHGIQAPAARGKRERVLSDDELRWLLQACREAAYPFGSAVQFALLTGQRDDSEVCAAVWGDIDMPARIWRIPGSRTKNKRDHLVPLSDAAMTLIQSMPRIHTDAGHLFVNGTVIRKLRRIQPALHKRMLELADGEQIAPWVLHDLRRTMITLMNEKLRIAPHVVEAVVNHISGPAKAGVAGVYNKALYLDERRTALEAWANYLDALGQPAINVLPLRA